MLTTAYASNTYTNDDDFSAVVMLNERTGSTSADMRPVVYKTTDSGKNWTTSQSIGSGFIRGLTCNMNDGKTCIAVGDIYGTYNSTTFVVYTSNNAGQSWGASSIDTHGGASGLVDISCMGKNCVAVGSYTNSSGSLMQPIVYRSYNGGKWTAHYPNGLGTLGSALRIVSCSGNDGQFCTAIGDYNSGYEIDHNTTTFVSYVSTDGGITWDTYPIQKYTSESKINSIACDKKTGQYCIAVGRIAGKLPTEPGQPLIYRTSNGGITWSLYIPKQGLGGGLNSVTCNGDNDEYCIAVGKVVQTNNAGAGIIYTSSDGGTQWTQSSVFLPFQGTANSAGFRAIDCSNDGKNCIAIYTSTCRSYVGPYCGSHNMNGQIPFVYTSTNYGQGGYNEWSKKFGFSDDKIWSIMSDVVSKQTGK